MLGLQTPQAYTLSPLLANSPPQNPGHYLLISHYVQCNLTRKHFRYTIKSTGNCGKMLRSKAESLLSDAMRQEASGNWNSGKRMPSCIGFREGGLVTEGGVSENTPNSFLLPSACLATTSLGFLGPMATTESWRYSPQRLRMKNGGF